ncbi:hypothetical protein Q0590_24380 [Rhodocytophaga aerolata]|uniref:PH domain-containing protein n=1 Tax=Rhodocytophaga aerolata TaxID=455078 RepID=A0ABT8RBE6_9BACT|nr:hypothetical protein [Rhodocytophaga aerolata]MDO1449435.1 hypothetical protein [Rhodocytophaga aerolata]
MNKVLALLLVLVIAYQSLSPLINLFSRRKIRRKEYKVTFSKQLNHLFSATLLLLVPLVTISSYYQFYEQLPLYVKTGLIVLGSLCVISALVSLYLYREYSRKTPYDALIYDSQVHTMELSLPTGKSIIRLPNVHRVEWYRTQNAFRMMPWSNFEYFILELRNGSRVIVTSLMVPPAQFEALLNQLDLEIIRHKKIIPTIK